MSVVSINSKLAERRIDTVLQKMGIPRFILATEPLLKEILLSVAYFEKCVEQQASGIRSKESSLQELKRIRHEMVDLLEIYEEEDREWVLKNMDEAITEIEKDI